MERDERGANRMLGRALAACWLAAAAPPGIRAEPAEPAAAAAPAGEIHRLSFEEILQIALERNLGLRQERTDREQAAVQYRLARVDRFYPRAWLDLDLPTCGQETERELDGETGIERFIRTDSTLVDGSLNLNWPIFTGGRFGLAAGSLRLDQELGDESLRTYSNSARLEFVQPLAGVNQDRLEARRAWLTLQGAGQGLRGQEVELAASVAETFYGLVRSSRKLEIGRRRVAQAQAALEIAAKKFKAGLIPEVDLFQEEVRLHETRLGQLDALIETQLAWARFQRVVGG